MPLRTVFDKFYEIWQNEPKKRRRELLIEAMLPYHAGRKYAAAFVEQNLERKRQNAHRRMRRAMNKCNLNGFNYFVTFTYSDEKLTAEEFYKKLRAYLKNKTARNGWKYYGVWEGINGEKRLHFHALMNIPPGTMPGELVKEKSYNTNRKRVNAYNRMINALSLALCCPNLQKLSINGLQQANVAGNNATLNDQDVTRKINSFQNVSKQGINNKKMTDKKNGYTQKSMATSSFIARDGNRSLKVSIISGDGVISKKSLFFQEKKYVDFSIEIEYSGAEKLKSLKAEIPKLQGGKKTFTVKEGVNKFQLEAKEYCFPNIRITVTALIKLGLFTTKELKCTVSKNFAWVNRKVE